MINGLCVQNQKSAWVAPVVGRLQTFHRGIIQASDPTFVFPPFYFTCDSIWHILVINYIFLAGLGVNYMRYNQFNFHI